MAYQLHYASYPGEAGPPPAPITVTGPPGPPGSTGPQGPPGSVSAASSLTVGGTTITGFGAGIGQALGPLVNYQGSGFPGLFLTKLILSRGTSTISDFSDVQINRSTSFSGGTLSNINAGLRLIGNFGAGDATQEWMLTASATTHGTSGGLALGGFLQGVRAAGATDPIWAGISDAIDQNDAASSVSGGSVLAHEFDVESNRADDATNAFSYGGVGVRKIIQLVAIRKNTADATQTEVSHGIWFTTGHNAAGTAADDHMNLQSAIGFGVGVQMRQALDTRGAVTPTGSSNPVAAVSMSAGHVIDFNGGAALNSAPGNYLAYDAATSKLKYYVGGVAKWSVDASGNVRAAGTITPSVTP